MVLLATHPLGLRGHRPFHRFLHPLLPDVTYLPGKHLLSDSHGGLGACVLIQVILGPGQPCLRVQHEWRQNEFTEHLLVTVLPKVVLLTPPPSPLLDASECWNHSVLGASFVTSACAQSSLQKL